MRSLSLVVVAAAAAACHASASVERTMPVANLQAYNTVALGVRSSTFAAQGRAMFLEQLVQQRLHERCSFTQVVRPGQAQADVVLDLNITNIGRGGGGFITNPNLATVDTLLVLTDGGNGELLGTARIHGKSSGMLINNNEPESEAIEAVAKSVADLLAKSGCSGPRVAKAEPPPPPPPVTGTGSGGAAAPSEAQRAQAEQLNEQGKEKLRGADLPGALAAFQQANQLVPDAKYEFNVCLTFEAQEQWPQAMTACQQAKAMNPEPRLAQKIDHRLDLLKNHQ